MASSQTSSQQEASNNLLITTLYDIYDKLSSAEDKTTVESEFKELLLAVNGSEKERRLASQFITRFIEFFPHLQGAALNSLFDLLEDELVSIRKQTEKDLVTACKKVPTLVATVADVFAQIFQTANTGEFNVIQECMSSLFYINTEQAVVGFCAQIATGDPIVRDRCLKFLKTKFMDLGPELGTVEVESRLFKELVKAAKAFDNSEHFKIAMDLLNSTKFIKSIEGQQYVVKMIENALNIKKDLKSTGEDAIAKLIVCTDNAFPYFNDDCTSASLFTFYCSRVLPKIGALATQNEKLYMTVQKMAIDLASFFKKLDAQQAKLCLDRLLQHLDEFLVSPPDPDSDVMPNFNFSILENLLYLIYKIGSIHHPIYAAYPEDKLPERFQDKLAYLMRAVVGYTRRLREDLRNHSWEYLAKETTKVICLRTLSNVTLMAKDLYYKTYLTQLDEIRLAWQTKVAAANTAAIWSNRTSSGSGGMDQRRLGYERKIVRIYKPPSGKYSRTRSTSDESPARRARSSYGRRSHYY